jgi:hypothetical protein
VESANLEERVSAGKSLRFHAFLRKLQPQALNAT